VTKNSGRRLFLKGSLVTGLLAIGASLGLITPGHALADWPASAFDAKKINDALNILFGKTELINKPNDIMLTAPDIAENGAVVPVTVQSDLEGIESITLLVDKNPNSLIARFKLAKNAKVYIKTNIKMAETSNLIAVLKAGDKLYSTRRKVKVTLNGCGN
jgi:sulfur-oxidizing protein SoxY